MLSLVSIYSTVLRRGNKIRWHGMAHFHFQVLCDFLYSNDGPYNVFAIELHAYTSWSRFASQLTVLLLLFCLCWVLLFRRSSSDRAREGKGEGERGPTSIRKGNILQNSSIIHLYLSLCSRSCDKMSTGRCPALVPNILVAQRNTLSGFGMLMGVQGDPHVLLPRNFSYRCCTGILSITLEFHQVILLCTFTRVNVLTYHCAE